MQSRYKAHVGLSAAIASYWNHLGALYKSNRHGRIVCSKCLGKGKPRSCANIWLDKDLLSTSRGSVAPLTILAIDEDVGVGRCGVCWQAACGHI